MDAGEFTGLLFALFIAGALLLWGAVIVCRRVFRTTDWWRRKASSGPATAFLEAMDHLEKKGLTTDELTSLCVDRLSTAIDDRQLREQIIGKLSSLGLGVETEGPFTFGWCPVSMVDETEECERFVVESVEQGWRLIVTERREWTSWVGDTCVPESLVTYHRFRLERGSVDHEGGRFL